MAILTAAGLAEGVNREAVRPFVNAGFPWHAPEVVRAANQPADAWWHHLEPIFARAFRQVGQVDDDRATRLARQGARGRRSENMREFDEDRPSISGRKISSNIPPTVPGYEEGRPYFKWTVAAILVLVVLIVFLARVLR